LSAPGVYARILNSHSNLTDGALKLQRHRATKTATSRQFNAPIPITKSLTQSLIIAAIRGYSRQKIPQRRCHGLVV
jgi:hypothetical protein